MNVYGVAREVAVLYGVPLRPLDRRASRRRARRPPRRSTWSIEAPDLCPRFCARVLDVRIGPSPAWLRDRLEAVGRAPHQQRRRPHQLRDDGDGPAHPRLRPRPRSRSASCTCAGPARARRVTTLDGVERTLHARRIGVVGGTRRRRSPWPGSWAAPRARSATRRARSRSRRPTGTRSPSAARPRRSACTPRPRTASSAGPIPRGRRRPWRASPTCWRRSARARRGPGLIDRHPAPRPRRTRVSCARPDRAPSWASTVPGARARGDPGGPRLRRCGPGRRARPRSRSRPGAATSRARSTSSRRSAGITGLAKHPVHAAARGAAAGPARPRSSASAPARRAAAPPGSPR